MKRFFGCLLVFCFLGVTDAKAQEFKAAYPGGGSVTMTGAWRFHTSDDLRWADPKLDDSGWETITADSPWGSQTHPGYVGFAWYRRAIEVDGVDGPLSIAMPPVDDVYELYWNGVAIGGRGIMPPDATWNAVPQPDVIALPKAEASRTLKGVLAIRVWKVPLDSLSGNDMGGLNGPPSIGASRVLSERLNLKMAKTLQSNLLQILEGTFLLVIGCFAIGMWARDSRKRLYLWLGLFLLPDSGRIAFLFPAFQRIATLGWYQFYLQMIGATEDLAIWMLVMTLFGLDQVRWWRRATFLLMGIYVGAQLVDTSVLAFWSVAGPGIQLTDGITTAIYSLLPVYLFVLLAAGLRRRRDVTLLPLALACIALNTFGLINGALGQGKRFTHIDFQAFILKAALHFGPDYRLTLRGQIVAVMLVVMVWTVVRQQTIERRRQHVLEAEVKSAKEVQSVLVPEAMEPVAGFAISTLYWPAEEVGGDLFQVLPGKDGDVLVVLADVSGKGLKAAMTVSVMVGAVRTLAEYTTSPVEILQGLNRRLMGRTDGGFATCVVMHVSADGQVTMGNAGHLAPFVNGEEMAATGSLPLGLAYDAEFEESRFALREGDDVTIYTDGVLEAQSKSGELYGFERAAEIMRPRPTVRAIAEAAKAFGQMDDITVVKIIRVHAEDVRERMSVDLRTVAVG
ncbi:hypothetical protein HDF16_002967 [Granulicella aggregans]|uniref:PPM-type phosphatase domain-containing protein n=1 Tax=Granulicella aggregans TaxID=474949 RepID=A0A7W7ZE84_9BACT|nr:PP2C family protein-serine/threonine phosphatase [Granulicella aggregans]MBB5058253.1 hypothetical protein [Granulicella aggregans]